MQCGESGIYIAEFEIVLFEVMSIMNDDEDC